MRHSPPSPFLLAVPDGALRDLHRRLARTRWPDELLPPSWDYGTNRGYLTDLVRFWQTDFDWRAVEASINAVPQFTTDIAGARIHFAYAKGVGPRPLPLVLTHGWPSTFWEFQRIIRPLTNPEACGGDPVDAFDIVLPSLPGFGLSGRPDSTGMSPKRVASLWLTLMRDVLGYQKFAAFGTDIGAGVTTIMALLEPDALLGIHLTYVTGAAVVRFLGPGAPPLSEAERSFVARSEEWAREEGAYAHVHRTRPQTLSYGLNDSPVGLAAWMIEKFRAWSDCDGDVERRFSKEDLLTTVMLYWVTETIGSSMRMYREGSRDPWLLGPDDLVRVPTGAALFPKDIANPPRAWAERVYQIDRWTEMPRGGHFAALEEPALLVEDLRAFFRPLRTSR